MQLYLPKEELWKVIQRFVLLKMCLVIVNFRACIGQFSLQLYLHGLEAYYLSKFVFMIEKLLAEGQVALQGVSPKGNGLLKR